MMGRRRAWQGLISRGAPARGRRSGATTAPGRSGLPGPSPRWAARMPRWVPVLLPVRVPNPAGGGRVKRHPEGVAAPRGALHSPRRSASGGTSDGGVARPDEGASCVAPDDRAAGLPSQGRARNPPPRSARAQSGHPIQVSTATRAKASTMTTTMMRTCVREGGWRTHWAAWTRMRVSGSRVQHPTMRGRAGEAELVVSGGPCIPAWEGSTCALARAGADARSGNLCGAGWGPCA